MGHKIKAVQSDNGREFCNAKMDAIFKNAGIKRRFITTYIPQNGIAEQKNRTLIEAARCMLIQSGYPPFEQKPSRQTTSRIDVFRGVLMALRTNCGMTSCL